MLGIDNSSPLLSWPTKGFISEFNFGNCCRIVEVTRGKHKDVSGLMCLNAEVTETVWYDDDDVTLDQIDYYCWEIEQYDAFIKKCREEQEAFAG